ncbi:MAG TPA: hypothetical protein VIX20_12235, partial [Ktedonobacteraceae bacterium]
MLANANLATTLQQVTLELDYPVNQVHLNDISNLILLEELCATTQSKPCCYATMVAQRKRL